MKIVILDGHSANPGDLSWDELIGYGSLEVYPQSSSEEALVRAQGAAALLTNKVALHKPQLDQLPELRYIGILATGYNLVDLVECEKRGIAVTNIPGYSSHSVCQMTFALILNLTNHLVHHNRLVTDRSWSRSSQPCLIEGSLIELAGLKLGLVGFGQIAQEVAKVALAFGMRVHATTLHPERYRRDWPQVRFVDLAQLRRDADIISLHCPLNEETNGLVKRDFILAMKPGALLINTARGQVVDEPAVAAALRAGELAGYATDVLSTEPPAADHPLLDAPNTFLTPHIAWATVAARRRLIAVVQDNLRSFVEGGRKNRLV